MLKVIGDNGAHHQPKPLGTFENWRLEIHGKVERPVALSVSDLARLAAEPFRQKMAVHCVSAGGICGAAGAATFEGVPFAALAESVRPIGPIEELRPTVEFISRAPGSCGPRSERHCTSLPLSTCLDPSCGVMLAWGLDGERLPYANGGPLRSVVGPALFFYKGIKWLDEIRFVDKPLGECRGTWETYAGYHNRARVELEERFEPQVHEIVAVGADGDVTRLVTDAEERRLLFERMYGTRNLSRLVAAKLDDAIKPFPKEFSGVAFAEGKFTAKIRGTNFAGAEFFGARMSGANFSLSKFSGAKFSRDGREAADMRGCDLEGAYLTNAHLQNVCMKGACLANATFVLPNDFDKPTDRVRGLEVRKAKGIDPRTAEWLRRNGAVVT